MSDDNRTQFNDITRKVLELLTRSCPVPTRVDAAALGLPEGEWNQEERGAFTVSNRTYKRTPEEVFLNLSLQWLEAEGYVRSGGGREHYVATMKLLTLYNQVPNALSS